MGPITFFDGKALCSQRDPKKEANLWCENIYQSFSHCWVLGIGAGYHIQSLAAKNKNSVICAIDHRKQIVDEFRINYSNLNGQVLAIHIELPSQILNTKEFDIYGVNISQSFHFYPSQQGSEKLYAEIQKNLIGKTSESFEKIAKFFNVNLSFEKTRLNSLREFNIKEIESLYDGIISSHEKKLISILRELVR